MGPRFIAGERLARTSSAEATRTTDTRIAEPEDEDVDVDGEDRVAHDKRDLDWATVMKRTFEAYIRGERPNMYGEWVNW